MFRYAYHQTSFLFSNPLSDIRGDSVSCFKSTILLNIIIRLAFSSLILNIFRYAYHQTSNPLWHQVWLCFVFPIHLKLLSPCWSSSTRCGFHPTHFEWKWLDSDSHESLLLIFWIYVFVYRLMVIWWWLVTYEIQLS